MSIARLIDGNEISARVRTEIGLRVDAMTVGGGPVPGLAVVLVGDDPASQVYVRNKNKRAAEAGFQSFEHMLPAATSQADLLALVRKLNDDKRVDGILVQLPLPGHLDSQAVIEAIDPAKDVDGLSPWNAGMLAGGGGAALVPCTPMGCLHLLRRELPSLAGLDAVVVGRSNLVGRPMAQLLLKDSCTVTIAHSKSRDLPALCRRADILVAATGKPRMVKGDWIKPGAIVIDVGINRVPGTEPGKTRLVGDVAFDEAVEIAAAITPVPGGVGPMTIAMLLRNTLEACCRNHGLPWVELS
jgi:methylenetetrahydrofolate dehydrogenase (NADP+)/methenyltetrahydrofolate cyclohydrolase